MVVEEWFLSNHLILNQEKTQSTIFSLREVSGNRLDSVRYLGVDLDAKLLWEPQVVRVYDGYALLFLS